MYIYICMHVAYIYIHEYGYVYIVTCFNKSLQLFIILFLLISYKTSTMSTLLEL